MRKKQKIDSGAIGINPFRIDLKIPVVKVADVGRFSRDEEGIYHPDRYAIDKRECVKVYRFPGLRKVIVRMSPAAQCLFLWLCMKIDKDAEFICVDRGNYMKEAEIKSVNTYKAAVKELCRYCFIAEVVDHVDVFWINPAYFFNGNAAAKFPENVIVEAEILTGKRTKKGSN